MPENNHLSLLKKILLRLLDFALTMLILSVVAFCFARRVPGNPLQPFYGDMVELMTSEELTTARTRLGLDVPLTTQYVRWIGDALQGDPGLFLKYKKLAMDAASPLAGNTLILGLTSYLLVFLLTTLLAVACALHEDPFTDRLICKIGMVIYYLPSFWLGVVLILIFSIYLKWSSSGGAYDIGRARDTLNCLRHTVLPLVVMIVSHLRYYAYMTRGKLPDELRQDYVPLTKGKGPTDRQTVWKHCLRNVVPTIVSIMATSTPHVLSGIHIAEAIFNYPGISALSIGSAKYHDYNLLILLVLITGALVILSSMVAQTVNEAIDSRMKEMGVSAWQR